jgi:hypothetical protein
VASNDRSIEWIFYVSGGYKSIATGGTNYMEFFKTAKLELQGMISTRREAAPERNRNIQSAHESMHA